MALLPVLPEVSLPQPVLLAQRVLCLLYVRLLPPVSEVALSVPGEHTKAPLVFSFPREQNKGG